MHIPVRPKAKDREIDIGILDITGNLLSVKDFFAESSPSGGRRCYTCSGDWERMGRSA